MVAQPRTSSSSLARVPQARMVIADFSLAAPAKVARSLGSVAPTRRAGVVPLLDDHARAPKGRPAVCAQPTLSSPAGDDELASHLDGADAVVFAAGAGQAAGRHARRPWTAAPQAYAGT